ncbi:hypothetical protein lerEdw1_018499 [Lerista edwardsae]|nr:hypothetical protein lerEdw1_018499 [Lerista edwardsae]
MIGLPNCQTPPERLPGNGEAKPLLFPVLYHLEITSNGPITTDAQATICATLHRNSRDVSPAHNQKYHFDWIYAPLSLVEKSERGSKATIIVTSPYPGIFPISVQVAHTGCWSCRTLARNLTVLQVSEFIVGNLSVSRIEDRSIVDTYQSSPERGPMIRASFFLHDPSHYFKAASFVYRWDFGDGTELVTEESSVYHNYSTTGTCVVHLSVVAEWMPQESSAHRKKSVRRMGHFAAASELMGAVRSIHIVGSREASVMENVNLSLHVQGSPPLSLCWLIKTECDPLEGIQCHLVEMKATVYHLSHVFSDAGRYCLSVRVENGVNGLQAYQEIHVKPSGIDSIALALPCIALLSALLGLAVYVSFRSSAQPKDLVEVADFDFSPGAAETLPPPDSQWCCRQLCCSNCFASPPQEPGDTVREHHSLLPPSRKAVKMYTA